ncbi:MAG: hypothetical protein WC082_02190 [Victivallales bacterium]
MSLEKYKTYFLDSILDLLWTQWSGLGVSGYGEARKRYVTDPEALLVFSCSMCRYDARLFDEILDWLTKNERFISIQRLRAVLSKENFSSGDILGAVAAHMAQKNPTQKWRRLADAQKRQLAADTDCHNLFFLKNGNEMPLANEEDLIFRKYGYLRPPVKNRERSIAFPPGTPETLLLQIRSLLGIGARSETLLYLFLNGKGSISEIASGTYYSWRSIQDVLFEMGHSGLLYFPEAKRGRFYRFDGKPWLDILLKNSDKKIEWLCWPPLFRSFELIWEKLNSNDFLSLSALAQSAELRSLMREEIAPRLEHAGLGSMIAASDSSNGEEYLETFCKNIDAIIKYIS